MNAENLLHLAECDFKVCTVLEKQFQQDHAVRAAAFHLQQAVEKLLKSAIYYNGGIPADTNDIGYLAKQCEPFGIVFDEFIADTLTLWEMQSRYEPHISFTQEKYNKAKQAYIDIFQKLKPDITHNNESGFELKM